MLRQLVQLRPLRTAARQSAATVSQPRWQAVNTGVQMRMAHSPHDDHHEESYEEYNERYLHFFNKEADDVFELSRGLNNAFNTDIVPSAEVLIAALKCARRLNAFPVATRVVEALREKLDGDQKSYEAYLQDLKPTLTELGVPSPEELGR